MGCVMQVGAQALNVGRNAVLAADWPEIVPATTVDRQCGSTQQAAHFAAQGVMAGAYDIVVAAGVEVMSLVPMGASIGKGLGFPFTDGMNDRYDDKGGLVPQGISAEMIADKWNLSRDRPRHLRRREPAAGRPGSRRGSVRERDHPGPLHRPDRDSGDLIESDEMVTADEGIREAPPSSRWPTSSRRSSPTARSPPATPRRSPTARPPS